MTGTRTIYLDWTPEAFQLIPKSGSWGLSFLCQALDGRILRFHEPVDEMRAAYLSTAECLRCEQTIFRPSLKPPHGMIYRWATWQYTIQEEP